MNKANAQIRKSPRSKSTLYWIMTILGLWLIALIFYCFHMDRWGWDEIYHTGGLAELYGPFSKGLFDNYLSPELASGSGLPSYVYYSQWLYYPPYLFTTLGFGLIPSFALTYATLICIAWLGFFKLARFHVSTNFAALGAIMFVTCNSFLGDIYTRFSYGQAFGYALVPMSFYAVHKAMLSPNRLTILFPIFMLSTIILTYPFGFMNIGPLLPIYCLIILPSKNQFFDFLSKGIIISLSTLAVTAFFWLPGLIEQHYIVGGDAVGKNYSTYSWTLDIALNFSSHVNLGAFLNIALFSAICLHVILLRHSHKTTIFLVCVLLYFFMLTPFSRFVWDSISILQANLSVNRMLVPLSFVSCLYVVLVFDSLHKKALAGSITLVLCIIMLGQGSEFIYRNTAPDLRAEALAQTFPEDINAQLEAQLEFTRGLRYGIAVDEFKPNISLPLPAPIVSAEECQKTLSLPAYVNDIQRQSIVLHYDVDHAGCFIKVPIYWNIRYQAIDETGNDLIIGIDEERLALMIQTANKSGTIGLRFTDPKYVTRAKRLSAIALILLMLFTMRQTINCRRDVA